jgi:hypothetical protein
VTTSPGRSETTCFSYKASFITTALFGSSADCLSLKRRDRNPTETDIRPLRHEPN